MSHTSNRLRIMMQCALFAALTAVCSQIAIPTPWGVPINLALFSVYMAGTMLGAVGGFVSQLVFVSLAAVGLPVLAGFAGGPAAIFGLTGGYIVGFVLAALIVGFLASHGKRTVPFLCLYMVVGCAACYLLGTIWYSTLSGNGFFASLAVCVLPYLPCDVFKILLAAVLTRALDRRLAVSRK